ncbi:MAG: 4Fe-4S cluster-binding domain-containing protein [Lachnospiraceae bacterium]|nr:4Fe-4S cluster-binding domain-containing protein [Lachnospiraceae bacterium]
MDKILNGEQGFQEFAMRVNLSPLEIKNRKKMLDKSYMPFAVSDYYTDLCQKLTGIEKEQMINQVLPPIMEKPVTGRFDPYGNALHRKGDSDFLQHKYKKTLLFHLNNHCLSNCQFCYKVREIRTEKGSAAKYLDNVEKALQYLNAHPEIDDVLITGGDPMMLSPELLIKCLSPLLRQPTVRFIRIATKALSFMPSLFNNDNLLSFFAEMNQKKQITIVSNSSHHAEFSQECEKSIAMIQGTKSQIRSQPVLMRGVNDTSESLIKLHQKILDNKMIFYYISLFMPVLGVEQYAMPIHEAYMKLAEAKASLTGIEKKSMFILAHDFGKIEVCGFMPTYQNPQKIVLRWHQIVDSEYLSESFKMIPQMGLDQLMILKYEKWMHSLDDILRGNYDFY